MSLLSTYRERQAPDLVQRTHLIEEFPGLFNSELLADWAERGVGPPFIKFGVRRYRYYSLFEVERWIAELERMPKDRLKVFERNLLKRKRALEERAEATQEAVV
jgi:hypothetical protein